MDLDIDLTLDKVNYILGQEKEQELKEDLELKRIIEIIFQKDNLIKYPKARDPNLILKKLVEMIYNLFNLAKIERESFYKKKISEIKKGEIYDSIAYIKKNEFVNFNDAEYKNLYEEIKKFNFKKLEKLYEFIDMIIYIICFSLQDKYLLNFKICSLINEKILKKFNRNFDFKELEIDISDELCLSLLSDIFANEIKDEKCLLLLCLLVLKFRTVKYKINCANKNEVIKYIENLLSSRKETNFYNLTNDDIIQIVCGEVNNAQIEKIAPKFSFDSKNNQIEKENKKINSNASIKQNWPSDLTEVNFWDNSLNYKLIALKQIQIILSKINMDSNTRIELNANIVKLDDFFDKILEKNNQLISDINILKSDNLKLNLKINEMKESQNRLMTEIEKKEQKLKIELSEKEQKLKNDLLEKEKKYQAEINSMKKNEEKLNAKIFEMNKKEDALISKINHLEIEINQLKKDSAKKDEKINYIIGVLREISDYLVCPITLELFKEPVITPNGITYEKNSINYWLLNAEKKGYNQFDPSSLKNIKKDQLYPNKAIYGICEIILKIEKKLGINILE